jgi:acetylglutamate kinase
VVHRGGEPDLAVTLRSELESEKLPVVSLATMRHETTERRFEWLRELATSLETRKIVIVRRRGGLGPRTRTRLTLGPGHDLSSHDSGISVINLTTDYDALMASGLLEIEEDRTLLTRLRALLAGTHHQTVASVTSPFNVLRELFTEKGAGTLIKRGTRIARHDSYSTVDRPRLKGLLESSFRRKLLATFFERPPASVYVEESYRGAAIVEASPIASFLTKFAVDRVAQGEGMGRDLWQALLRDHSSLYWRAHPENHIAGWYTTLADGMMRLPEWNVYWRGVDPEHIPALIRDARTRAQDFRD